MPLFRYEIVDRTGKKLMGAMDAQSETDIRRVLVAKGYSVLSVISTSQPQTAPSVSPVYPVGAHVGQKTSGSWISVPPKELALFFRQLAQLLHSGIGIHQALTQLQVNTPHHGMRRVVEHLAMNVQSGGTLNEGMAQFPRVFAPHIVGTVAAGEIAGLLPIMLGDIALDYELEIRASNRVTKVISWILWSTTYGLFLFAPAIPLMMRGGFAALESEAAGGTAFIIKMMQPFLNVTMHVTLPLLVIPTILYHGIAWYLKQPNMRQTYHSLVLKVPRFGKASRERSMASFSRILWRLQNAGVMPIKAWEVASRVPENSVLAANVQAQTDSIAAGGRYSDALARAGFFSQDDIRLLQTAETTGQLPESLQRIAAFYEDAALVSANAAKWIGLRIAIFFLIIASGVVMIGAASYMGEMMNGVDKYMGVGD